MNLKDQLDALLDATAFDSTGAKIGAVRQVYADDASGKITFATVSTGIFSADAIVPLHGARLLDDELHVDHTRAVIRDSPRPDNTEDALTPEQEAKLLEYYGIETPTRLRGTAAPPSGPAAGAAGKPAKGDGKTTSTGAANETAGAGAGKTVKAAGTGVEAAAASEKPGAGKSPTAPGDGEDTATPGAGERAAADPASARRDGKGATTTRSTDGDTTADSSAPAKASGPGPATPAADPDGETGGKGPEPRRD
ncbi:PRC-barrel domain-containing protein [Dietzia lutea]|uniref:PRC-barrel domain-containing protein n=2 Tax=Dietzia lutea TaxID=546160 RepID=A0A2S1R4N6_9ACTN|nr:PRC-barrel domain-containing protein [Dietzia lutea]AWH91258.1 hypothetical protein A6035_02725 [Dietzia lutea]